MHEMIDIYIDYLLYERNYSINTINSYRENLNIFFNYLQVECLKYDDITYQDIRLFFNYLDKKNYSKNTISHIVSCIRSFYKYLVLNNVIDINPFNLVSVHNRDKKIPKFLYHDELEILFNVPNLNTKKGIRDRLILELLYATGMRVSELTEIKVKDIDLKNNQIKIRGKGNKERYVFFGQYALEYLKLYLENARDELLKTSNEYLLINNNGTRLTSRGVALIIDNVIKQSTLNTKISPHTLRHTFATHLINEGCDISSVQELLGHSSLKATQIYTHVTDDRLKKVYLTTHPRSNKTLD